MARRQGVSRLNRSGQAPSAPGPAVRLLALDLDGTIVSGEHGVTPRVRAAIRRAQEQGTAVTIATGRMFRSARRFARQLDITAPIICYQGALVRDPVTGETLHASSLPVEPGLAVVAFAKARRWHVNAYVDDELYMEAATPEGRFYAETSDVPIRLIPDLAAAVHRGTTKLVIVADEVRRARESSRTWTPRFGSRAGHHPLAPALSRRRLGRTSARGRRCTCSRTP